jgi:hypothetical protein
VRPTQRCGTGLESGCRDKRPKRRATTTGHNMALANISGNYGIQNVRGDDLITKLTLTLPH